MGGEVLILVNIPNSYFLLSLTHSAVSESHSSLLEGLVTLKIKTLEIQLLANPETICHSIVKPILIQVKCETVLPIFKTMNGSFCQYQNRKNETWWTTFETFGSFLKQGNMNFLFDYENTTPFVQLS